VLELRSVWGTGGGPEKTILLGAARSNPREVKTTVCYVRDNRDTVFGIDAKATALGIDYVEVRERHSFDPRVWRQLRYLVRERQIDIIHAHDYKTNLLALFLAKVERIVPLSTVHGWTGRTKREEWIYYPADKLLLRRFPRLVAVSSEIARTLFRWGIHPARVSIIRNAIDHEAFRRDRARETAERVQLGLAHNAIIVGGVGRLEPQKRFDLLIDAVAELRRKRPQICLALAGDGSLRAALEAQARARFPPGYCQLLGHRSDIGKLHHALDLFVQSSDYEGTPNAVLEAMALETPVIATDVGGTAELMEHLVHGLVVPPASIPAIVNAIEYAIDDRAATAERTAAARTRVEQSLSFDARARAIEDIYFGLMEQRIGSAGR
jgi:glycosyltransferase involved in cell wall biosynthesis